MSYTDGYTVIFDVHVDADLAGSIDEAAIIAADLIHEGLAADCEVIDHEATEINRRNDVDAPEVRYTMNLFEVRFGGKR